MSGFEEGGSKSVDECTEVKLGSTEELRVRSCGDEFPKPLIFPLCELEEQGRVLLSFELLRGGQRNRV